ncbi:MAG: DUF4834 family protein [Mediterranea massiliensis]|nr:DUF4834 family protein [Mediterranea massiliensis]
MFHIFGFIFLLITIILIAAFFLLISLVRGIFGLGNRHHFYKHEKANNTQSTASQTDFTKEDVVSPRKKIFDKNDGEYVEFEEVK